MNSNKAGQEEGSRGNEAKTVRRAQRARGHADGPSSQSNSRTEQRGEPSPEPNLMTAAVGSGLRRN